MDVPAVLQELVVVLGVAVAVVLALSHLRLPTIAGLIAAGALIGPGGLGLVHDAARITVLAEIGVVLLLFSIGLEFSLARLRRLWRVLLLGGGLQVGLTTLGVLPGQRFCDAFEAAIGGFQRLTADFAAFGRVELFGLRLCQLFQSVGELSQCLARFVPRTNAQFYIG